MRVVHRSNNMGWFGPDEQVPLSEYWKTCTKWMVVFEGGVGWRNSPSYEDRVDGEGPSCGTELVESASGETLESIPTQQYSANFENFVTQRDSSLCVLAGPELGDDGIYYVKTIPSEDDPTFYYIPINSPDETPLCRR